MLLSVFSMPCSVLYSPRAALRSCWKLSCWKGGTKHAKWNAMLSCPHGRKLFTGEFQILSQIHNQGKKTFGTQSQADIPNGWGASFRTGWGISFCYEITLCYAHDLQTEVSYQEVDRDEPLQKNILIGLRVDGDKTSKGDGSVQLRRLECTGITPPRPSTYRLPWEMHRKGRKRNIEAGHGLIQHNHTARS